MILHGGGVEAAKDGGSTGTDSGGRTTLVLKKGPWTAAEDEILAAYVREHGEGNWNAVQKNTGLARCGKSCRLRWANHLRPNLKKGAFTAEEERLIIQLHSQLGNKWARMAAHLPGRTDNEIKNFWNTRLKRLQRQGLPLYPPDFIPSHQLHHHHHHPLPSPKSAISSSSFTFQTTTNTINMLCPPPPSCSPTPCPTPTTPPPLSPVLSSTSPLSPHHQFPTVPTSSSSCINHNNNSAFAFPRPSPPLLKQPSLRFKRCFNADSCCNINTSSSSPNIFPTTTSFNTPFSPLQKSSSYASFLTLPHSSPPTPTGTSSFHTTANTPLTFPRSSFSLNCSSNFPANFTPNPTPTDHPVYSVSPELPSSQISPSTGIAFFDVNNFTENEKHNQTLTNTDLRRGSCELLEEVLEEAEALASGGGRPPKRRQLTSMPEVHNNNNVLLGSLGNYGSSNSIGLKPKEEEESLQLNVMQEDLAKLLDWGSESGGDISNGHSSAVTDDNLVIDIRQFASLFPDTIATGDEHNKNNTLCSWDNLPGIC